MINDIILEAKSCTLAYEKNKTILVDLNYVIKKGDFLLILGKNGVGKTTLLKAMMGLIKPYKGGFYYLNQLIKKGHRDFSYLQQSMEINADLEQSVYDFVSSANFGWKYGLPLYSADARKQVAKALIAVDAANLVNKKMAELSGGQKQKIFLAQCLINEPSILFLDEPLTYLDENAQQELMYTLKKLNREQTITIIMVTHNVTDILNLASHVLTAKNKTFEYSSIDTFLSQKGDENE